MNGERDVLVVGGGPAGLATAIFASLQGLRATVVERRSFPVDKPCGEGLMPSGVGLLEAMGVSPDGCLPFEGIRYVDGERVLEGRFRSCFGLGIRRTALSCALVARARELEVELLEDARVSGIEIERESVAVRVGQKTLRSRWLVAADGLRSPLRKRAGLEKRTRRHLPARYGMRRHYRVPPWTRLVEVHWGRGAEAYVTPVGEDEVGVALLWQGGCARYDEMLARFPDVERRVRGAEIVSVVSGAGPFRQRVLRVTAGRLALVGDAAGYVDALTGEGVALGFRGARALARAIASGRAQDYEREHWRLGRRYRLMTELLLALSRSPRLRRGVFDLLARRPALFSRLLHFHDGGNVVE